MMNPLYESARRAALRAATTRAAHVRVPLWASKSPTIHRTWPFSRLYERLHNAALAIEAEFLPIFNASSTRCPFAPIPTAISSGLSLVAWRTTSPPRLHPDVEVARRVGCLQRDHGGARAAGIGVKPALFDLNRMPRWLYHCLIVLHVRVPRVSVTHSTRRGVLRDPLQYGEAVGMECRSSSRRRLLREQNSSSRASAVTSSEATFLLSLSRRVRRLPVRVRQRAGCHYNRAGKWRTARRATGFSSIYNGVDPGLLAWGAAPARPSARRRHGAHRTG